MKFRKKPVIVEAVRFTPDTLSELVFFLEEKAVSISGFPSLRIKTLEGEMTVSPGDWVVKGVAGEFYPVKPDIFEQTYEKVEEAE